MNKIKQIGFWLITVVILFLGSCKKEEPEFTGGTYTIKGRIVPDANDTSKYWANAEISTLKIFDPFTQVVDELYGPDTVLTDSNGYFEINYSVDRKVDEVIVQVIFPGFNYFEGYYCSVIPNCNVKSPMYFFDTGKRTPQGECEGN